MLTRLILETNLSKTVVTFVVDDEEINLNEIKLRLINALPETKSLNQAEKRLLCKNSKATMVAREETKTAVNVQSYVPMQMVTIKIESPKLESIKAATNQAEKNELIKNPNTHFNNSAGDSIPDNIFNKDVLKTIPDCIIM